MTKPFLSIVIANYNYGRYLEEAIESVVRQDTVGKVELIICDAASTDNSVDIIRKYVNGLPPNTYYSNWHKQPGAADSQLITWWCSEKDGGQSSAFNKGFRMARGDWLTWLNADDFLLPGTLKALEFLIAKRPNAKWITGNKLSFDSDTGRIVQLSWGPHCQPPFLRGRHAFSAVFGPTTFFKREIYESVGPIDEQLHYAMDSAYWAKLTMKGIKQTRLHHICWAFRNHELSKTTGAQSDVVRNRRMEETAYWRNTIGYSYYPKVTNVWYLIWALWRVVDGSWIMRYLLKRRYEGMLIEDYCKEVIARYCIAK